MILLMVCITLLLAAPDALVSASYAAAREMAADGEWIIPHYLDPAPDSTP